MTKISHISLIPAFILAAFLLLSVFAALPAGAQGTTTPKDSCTLAKEVTVKGKTTDITIAKGTLVSSSATISIRDADVAIPNTSEYKVKEWGLICIINTVNVITDWIFIALLIVAVAFIAIAGFMWMTAGGNAEQQKKAGQMILAAVIGIIIAVLARVIPGIVTGILL